MKKSLYIKRGVLFACNSSTFKMPLGEYRRNRCLGLPMGRRPAGGGVHFTGALLYTLCHVYLFSRRNRFKKWKRASGCFSGLLGEVPLGEGTVCPSKARRLRSLLLFTSKLFSLLGELVKMQWQKVREVVPNPVRHSQLSFIGSHSHFLLYVHIDVFRHVIG